MRVKTSAAYLRRYAARGQRMAAKTRPSDRMPTRPWDWGRMNTPPNHGDRTVSIADVFPQLMGEEKWLV